MDPVDLVSFLQHAPIVKDDIVLLSILADVWEPLPVQCLAQNFVSLTSSYTAADVAQAFRAALDTITARPGSYDEADVCSHHYDVLCMGGMCRHFGFRNVGKRLGLLEHVDDDAPRLVARHKKYYLGKSRDQFVYTGSTNILQKLLDHRSAHPKVMKTAWKKARSGDAEGCVQEIRRWVHHPSVPSELSWGVQGDSVPWQPHLAKDLAVDVPRRGSSHVGIACEVRDRCRTRRGPARSDLALELERTPQTQAGLCSNRPDQNSHVDVSIERVLPTSRGFSQRLGSRFGDGRQVGKSKARGDRGAGNHASPRVGRQASFAIVPRSRSLDAARLGVTSPAMGVGAFAIVPRSRSLDGG